MNPEGLHSLCTRPNVVYTSLNLKNNCLRNVSKESISLFLGVSKCELHRVGSKVYMNPEGVHSLCTRPNVVYTSLNLKDNEIHSLNNYVN